MRFFFIARVLKCADLMGGRGGEGEEGEKKGEGEEVRKGGERGIYRYRVLIQTVNKQYQTRNSVVNSTINKTNSSPHTRTHARTHTHTHTHTHPHTHARTHTPTGHSYMYLLFESPALKVNGG